MDEKQFGRQIAFLRKELNLTQDDVAEKLHVSPQAVSKWENGHSLPETALLPALAHLLQVSIDELFDPGNLILLEAFFGDGIEAVNVTKRLKRLVENDTLHVTVTASMLAAIAPEGRAAWLTVRYKSQKGVCFSAALEGTELRLSSQDDAADFSPSLTILGGCYGTKRHHYDVMPKIAHYKLFNWDGFSANHEVFPSNPANDETEYLTLVYWNGESIKMATCAEGESLTYNETRTALVRQAQSGSCYIPNVPFMPPFGEGMECSWAAALTVALQSMGAKTTYAEVMGVSGACYRLAFSSPTWDYSSVDGLVAYDYALPGYAAYGYTPVLYGRIEKADRAEHRARIMKEIRSGMPVLGINLRVAPEWGVIGGYDNQGENLFCRTKYDTDQNGQNKNFQKVDNWPFLLCYFDQKRMSPTPRENLIVSLKVFLDCAQQTHKDGYFMGFKAYEMWAGDLRDDALYDACEDELLARRFSVNQFCVLSLWDARKSAFQYLSEAGSLVEDERISEVADYFEKISLIAENLHKMLDSGKYLDGKEARIFWTLEKRRKQADGLDEMTKLEKVAFAMTRQFIDSCESL